jgi:DnaK suppressor protein
MKTTVKKKTIPSKTLAVKPLVSEKFSSIHKELLLMREDIIKTVTRKSLPDGSEMGDSMDQANLSIEKELLFELSGNERAILDQIEAAIRKAEKGIYGLCESCHKPIPKPRLKAMPFARYCIVCQSTSERASNEEPIEDIAELAVAGEDKEADFGAP